MKLTKWLVVNHKGSARLTARKPKLSSNEVAIQLQLEVPDAIFKKPTFSVVVQLADGTSPDLTKVDVHAMQEAIEGVTGFNVRVMLPETYMEEHNGNG